jgi:hypothetical protein
VKVHVDGRRRDDGWTVELDPPAIAFDEAPEAGAIIEVSYQAEGAP